ncbi:uncharacterized protein LOC141631802 [Silene latifolia]|uniref:uncharacterized protein LOC141631802 n=1 Tax=Silene latifolia TaxID=37657 RepID=UPI003D77E5A3
MVDATTGHEMLTFMDAWSGYNQIKMHQRDQEKTAFMLERGIYCYNVMPFGLKKCRFDLPTSSKQDVQTADRKNHGETRYTSFEKLVLALVTASYKLRPYFESHIIHVVTNYPLKTIMRKPELSGRMTKWSVHMSGYDLQFEPRTPIKSQALTDFVSDFCLATQAEADKGVLTLCGNQEYDTWTWYIDGVSNAGGAGVGLILRSPKIRCEFKATNNEAQYEALIRGMQMAQGLNVKNLRVYGESLLMVNHVNNEYVARDSKMIAYLKVATKQKLKFRSFKITQVPRDQNVEADALAMLGHTFKPAECLDKDEARTVLHAIQSGDCGNHAGVGVYPTKPKDRDISGL